MNDLQHDAPPLSRQLRSLSAPRAADADVASAASDTGMAVGLPAVGRSCRTVMDCKQKVAELAMLANSARHYREKCSSLQGKATAAVMALQEALSSCRQSSPAINHLSSNIMDALCSATTLVSKYGHAGRIDTLLRLEAKSSVDEKFHTLVETLAALAAKGWEQADPSMSQIKRLETKSVRMFNAVASGNNLARCTLRQPQRGEVHALLHLPDPLDPQLDGVACWATEKHLKTYDIVSTVRHSLDITDSLVTCLAHEPPSYLWTGHMDGCIRLWCLVDGRRVAAPMGLYACPVTAVAVDPEYVGTPATAAGGSGGSIAWVGSADGEVVLVRHDISAREGSTGGRRSSSRVTGGSEENGAEPQPQMSAFGRAQSGGSTSNPGSSNLTHNLQVLQTVTVNLDPSWMLQSAASAPAPSTPDHASTSHSLLHASARVSNGSTGSLRRRNSFMQRSNTTLALIGSCFPAGRQRPLGNNAHAGELASIIVRGSRAWTAGGKSKSSCAVYLWDTVRREVVCNVDSRSDSWFQSPVTAMLLLDWSKLPGQAAPAADGASQASLHLITGHKNGGLIMWDSSHDMLKPVLRTRGQRSPVRGLAICEQLQLLAAGHANGKVLLRKLDPRLRLSPSREAGDTIWEPSKGTILAHRLGLSSMAGSGHVLVTSGRSGSIKVWPEATLRFAAMEANIQLPCGQGAVSQAITSLLGTSTSAMLPGMPTSPSNANMHPGSKPSTSSTSQLGPTLLGSPSEELQAGTGFGAGPPRWRPSGTNQADDSMALVPVAAPGALVPGGRPSLLHTAGKSGSYKVRGIDLGPWIIEYESVSRGKYLGAGSYGCVYMGRLNETNVAIKELKTMGSSRSMEHMDNQTLKELQKEAEVMASLRHPNIVLFMGICLEPPCVVTEFCVHGSLFDVLAKARADTRFAQQLTWMRRLQMAIDGATGMLHLHSHRPPIIHRDLKSPNLFVDKGMHVKVGDFNLSRTLATGGTSSAPSWIACSQVTNPFWHAPEVLAEGRHSRSSDVYSYGIVLWELLTWRAPWVDDVSSQFQNVFQVGHQVQSGVRPFIPEDRNELPGHPTPGVEEYIALVQRCWAMDPATRPSFDRVIQDLREMLQVARAQSPSGSRGNMQQMQAGASGSTAAGAAAAAAAAAVGDLIQQSPRASNVKPAQPAMNDPFAAAAMGDFAWGNDTPRSGAAADGSAAAGGAASSLSMDLIGLDSPSGSTLPPAPAPAAATPLQQGQSQQQQDVASLLDELAPAAAASAATAAAAAAAPSSSTAVVVPPGAAQQQQQQQQEYFLQQQRQYANSMGPGGRFSAPGLLGDTNPFRAPGDLGYTALWTPQQQQQWQMQQQQQRYAQAMFLPSQMQLPPLHVPGMQQQHTGYQVPAQQQQQQQQQAQQQVPAPAAASPQAIRQQQSPTAQQQQQQQQSSPMAVPGQGQQPLPSSPQSPVMMPFNLGRAQQAAQQPQLQGTSTVSLPSHPSSTCSSPRDLSSQLTHSQHDHAGAGSLAAAQRANPFDTSGNWPSIGSSVAAAPSASPFSAAASKRNTAGPSSAAPAGPPAGAERPGSTTSSASSLQAPSFSGYLQGQQQQQQVERPAASKPAGLGAAAPSTESPWAGVQHSSSIPQPATPQGQGDPSGPLISDPLPAEQASRSSSNVSRPGHSRNTSNVTDVDSILLMSPRSESATMGTPPASGTLGKPPTGRKRLSPFAAGGFAQAAAAAVGDLAPAGADAEPAGSAVANGEAAVGGSSSNGSMSSMAAAGGSGSGSSGTLAAAAGTSTGTGGDSSAGSSPPRRPPSAAMLSPFALAAADLPPSDSQ